MITFYTWLKQFQDQDDSIGDLSRDASNDADFPRTKNYGILLKHLKISNATDNALNAFKKAFSFYQKDVLNKDDSS